MRDYWAEENKRDDNGGWVGRRGEMGIRHARPSVCERERKKSGGGKKGGLR